MDTWAMCYTVSLLSSVNFAWVYPWVYLVHQPMVGLYENRGILNLNIHWWIKLESQPGAHPAVLLLSVLS